ncbi:hypothetical protein ABZ567_15755 [Streptomyces sp. NPDC016459]|uniref:hypothetical protein n=1 Tax=Streptomyces sp. NPDC016459 TaxID=3157190 RepID=UPI0033DF329B
MNDGVDPDYRDESPDSGSCLGNLRARLRSASGKLTVSRRAGTFRLTAEAPARLPGLATPDDSPRPLGDPAV